ncbi:pyridoxamine phosphate oxidase family protein [Xylaria bambusicola]|uniref:pyridoxamine phosphate oxidase family protein n=1 Tax=Xylaria bambusicola TaxID=326684 RepID=UPI002008D8CF|nr:pyridoxamine phosphate oxidase family protein [Xylaria bambusicola]KAI0520972.1 pyridoxamine phosphate oxidase family protein [Xylaria bambusicola]
MGAFYEEIPENVMEWIVKQKVFWVSTAPLSRHGHVNVSPKGGDCFGVPDRRTFWYMDMTGSGNETISHLSEPGNGRITILFNAFEGPPRILRLWGKGRVLEYGTPAFDEIVARENIKTMPGTRSVIVVDIHQVGTSCGYQVPFFSFVDYRRVLEEHFKKKVDRYENGKEEDSMDRYWALKNAYSMDGLPGMRRALKAGKEYSVAPIQKMVGRMAVKNGGLSNNGDLHVAYVVIALLAVLVAILAATHPAFEYFPAQRRMQGLLSQVTSIPGGLPSIGGLHL